MPTQPEIWVPTTLLGALSPVCATCGVILIVPPPLVSTSLFTRKFWIHSACRSPLRNRMVEYDLSTSTSCVLNHDLQAFSQRSHALLDVQLLSLLLGIQVFLLFCAPLCASTLRSFLLFSTAKMIANCKLVDMPQSDQQFVHQPLLQSCLNEVLVFHVALRLFVTRSAHSHQRVR